MVKKAKKKQLDPWIKIDPHATVIRYLINTSRGTALVEYTRERHVFEGRDYKYRVLIKAYLAPDHHPSGIMPSRKVHTNGHPTQFNAVRLLIAFYAENSDRL